MEKTLSDFFRAHERKPWQPGQVDCCLFVADWALWLGRSDPAEGWRGSYDTEDGFRAIINAAGGLVPLFEGCAAKVRAKRVQCAAAGDVAVIGSPNNIGKQFGAIFDGTLWNIRFKHNVGPLTSRPLAIWRI